MAIKRYEFGVNMLLIMFYAVTGGLMLLSAYGAICYTWNPAFLARRPAWYMDILDMYRICNIFCWILTFSWGITIYCQLTQRRITPLLVIFNSIAGFITGIIPAMSSDTDGGTVPFEMGSPHWGRTIASLVVLIIFALVVVASLVQKKSVLKYTAMESAYKGQISKQLYIVAVFLFWLSFVSFMGTTFMKDAHVIDGVNVWTLVDIQFIGGFATAIGGSTTVGGGLIVSQIQQYKRGVMTNDIL
jgi:hypothetical protein